jgi:hypothetical protein
MEIKDFVCESLTQIIDGVWEAAKRARGRGLSVNPPVDSVVVGDDSLRRHPKTGSFVQDVEFDIAITITEGTERKGVAKMAIWGAGIGAEGKTDSSQSAVSRLRFKVPLTMPGCDPL